MPDVPEGLTLKKPADDVPEGLTLNRGTMKADVPRDISLGQAGIEAVKHIPESAVGFGKSMVQPFVHPVETYENLKNLGGGVLQKFGIVSGEDKEKYADAVGQFLLDRYGSMENIKHTLATDPVGLAADVSMLLSGGGTAAARIPGVIGKVGEIAAATGRVIDPLSAVGAAVKGGATIGRKVAGDYLAHVGDRPLSEAVAAGYAGGARAQAFRESLRDPNSQLAKTVEETRSAVEEIGRKAGKAYRSGMVDIKNDKSILDFRDIDAEMDKTQRIGTYKGIDLETPKVKEVRDRIAEKIEIFKDSGYFLGAHEYHTPEGFDALKRAIGTIAKETERGSPASKVAWGLYNAVKDTIVKQTPAYAKVMEGYEEGLNLIKELETELAGKPGANIGPAMRKLQSVMRNNVHTAYGYREGLARLLVENGADHLITRLAGQALSTWTPRGFGRAIASGDLLTGIGVALWGHPDVAAKMLLTLPLMMPRVLGEAAYYIGRILPYTPGRKMGDVLFQAGRLEQAEQTPLQHTVEGYPYYQFDGMGNLITPANAMEAPLRNQLPADAIRIERERQRREAEAQ